MLKMILQLNLTMKIIYDSAELGERGFVYFRSGEVDFVFIFTSKILVDALMTLTS